MLYFVQGDMFQGNHEVLVNPINARGVAGKGVALLFKNNYPEWFSKYREVCSKDVLMPGDIWVYHTGLEYPHPRYIFNAVTKLHWRYRSEKLWVIHCYQKIANLILKFKVKSIGIPPLGCGCGGLYWGYIKPNVENILGSIEDCNIYHYLPIKENY